MRRARVNREKNSNFVADAVIDQLVIPDTSVSAVSKTYPTSKTVGSTGPRFRAGVWVASTLSRWGRAPTFGIPIVPPGGSSIRFAAQGEQQAKDRDPFRNRRVRSGDRYARPVILTRASGGGPILVEHLRYDDAFMPVGDSPQGLYHVSNRDGKNGDPDQDRKCMGARRRRGIQRSAHRQPGGWQADAAKTHREGRLSNAGRRAWTHAFAIIVPAPTGARRSAAVFAGQDLLKIW